MGIRAKDHGNRESRRTAGLCLCLCVALCLGVVTARAANDAGVAGAYLRYGGSARSLAMGGTAAAVGADVSSVYWNPAGLSQLRTTEITAMGATLFENTQYSFISCGLPSVGKGAFALSGAFTGSDGFQRASLWEDLDSSFGESEGIFSLSYALGTSRIGWGVSLKSVSQEVAGVSGSGLGADVGLYLRPDKHLGLGISLQNALQPELLLEQTSELLPRTVRGGLAIHLLNNRFLIMADLLKTDYMDADFQGGVELWIRDDLVLRGGHDSAHEQSGFGTGFRHENWQIDYAFLTHELGSTSVLSDHEVRDLPRRRGDSRQSEVQSVRKLPKCSASNRDGHQGRNQELAARCPGRERTSGETDERQGRTAGEPDLGRRGRHGTTGAGRHIPGERDRLRRPGTEMAVGSLGRHPRLPQQNEDPDPYRCQRLREPAQRWEREMTKMRLTLLAVLVTALTAFPARAETGPEELVLSEAQLWAAAGESFVRDADKGTAQQKYQLFLTQFKNSEKAARAQFMVAECFFFDGEYEAALLEYRKVGKYKGDDDYLKASILLRTGECMFNLQQLDKALEAYTELLDKYPETFLTAEASFELGQVQASMQDWESLEANYYKLLENKQGYRDLPRVRFAMGIMAYARGNFEEAADFFNGIESDLGLYYLGRCKEENGQYIVAIQYYRQALRRYPDSPLADDVSFSIAEAFYDSEQYKVASRSYVQFLEKYPESEYIAMTKYKLACVSFLTGEYNDTINRLDELFEAHPDDPIIAYAHYLNGSCQMKLGSTSHAIFAYTEVVQRYPGSSLAASALHKIVFAYADEKNYPQAILMADEFLDSYHGHPLTARVQVLRGYSLLKIDEFELAVREFQNVLDRNVNTEIGERALFLATVTYFEMNQYDRLITNYHYIASRLLPSPSIWRARTYHHLGDAYYSQGLYREAGGMYRLVLTGYPRSDVAVASLQGLTACHSQMGDYDLALEEQEKFLYKLINSDSKEGGNSLAVGSLYFNQHEYEKALEQFTRYIEKHPDAPDVATAYLNQGDCYYRLQYYEQAIESWSAMLARYPDIPESEEAMYRLADTQFGLGRFDEAIASYEALKEKAPNGDYVADASFGLANCYYNKNDDELAIQVFTEFLKTFPDDPRGSDAELGIQSAYMRSGRDMEEYLVANPDSPMAPAHYWTKGQNAFAAGDYEAATNAFEKVTLDYAGSDIAPEALFYLAECYYSQEENEQARAVYENFIYSNPEHELVDLARFREGTCLYKLAEYERAASSYEMLTDLSPNGEYSALALYNAGLCYQEMEDWPDAIGVLMRFQSEYPDDERSNGIWLQIATLYQEELGDFTNALDAYALALEKGEGGIEEIGYRQGQCNEKLGRTADAIACYESSAAGADKEAPHRIASLVQIGQLSEDLGDWGTALQAYTRIVSSDVKPEWTAMAQGRIQEIQANNNSR